jgi:hypothetical protein
MTAARLHRVLAVTLLAASAGGQAAGAHAAEGGQEVFVSIGEHGEVSYSDVATADAERRTLPPFEPDVDVLAELDRRIQQTLDVARALEQSRLAREEARAGARREALATATPPITIVESHYAPYPYVYAPYRHARLPRHRPGKGDRHDPPAAEPRDEDVQSRPFIWRND